VKPALLDALLDAVREERTAVLATDLADGRQLLLLTEEGEEVAGALEPTPALREAAREAARADTSRTVEIAGREVFLRVYNPRLRLVLVGAVHIAQPLALMATAAGFRVLVVDPRRAFATPERFPGVALVLRWPEEAFAELVPDHRTAVVTLTHDPKLDDPALEATLGGPAFYVGALGSRRTHARRRERLADRGVETAELDRIRGPVGLDIGARTPAEIAVAILAEIISALRSPRA
jgi:xanthine dehydrogenase accessory factor